MAVITMRQMLEAGVHFGHQTRRWNPKMKRFIFGERNGIYIIDLEQTLTRVDSAYGYVRDLVAGGGTLMFVGTKKQAQDPVRSYAEKCGMPFVNERWLGGMLTNFDTISKRVAKMLEYERMRDLGRVRRDAEEGSAAPARRELEKLQRNLGGLRGLTKRPDAVFVLDTKKEHIAVTEANKLGIPVVAVVDTNVDPELVQYPIPGNDDAIRANSLLARVIADAVEEGRFIAAKRDPRHRPRHPLRRAAGRVRRPAGGGPSRGGRGPGRPERRLEASTLAPEPRPDSPPTTSRRRGRRRPLGHRAADAVEPRRRDRRRRRRPEADSRRAVGGREPARRDPVGRDGRRSPSCRTPPRPRRPPRRVEDETAPPKARPGPSPRPTRDRPRPARHPTRPARSTEATNPWHSPRRTSKHCARPPAPA